MLHPCKQRVISRTATCLCMSATATQRRQQQQQPAGTGTEHMNVARKPTAALYQEYLINNSHAPCTQVYVLIHIIKHADAQEDASPAAQQQPCSLFHRVSATLSRLSHTSQHHARPLVLHMQCHHQPGPGCFASRVLLLLTCLQSAPSSLQMSQTMRHQQRHQC
jgi:hypothetical protein